jgi:hypothetical protein
VFSADLGHWGHSRTTWLVDIIQIDEDDCVFTVADSRPTVFKAEVSYVAFLGLHDNRGGYWRHEFGAR